MDLASLEAERLAWTHARLKDALLARLQQPGVIASEVKGVGMARRDHAGMSEHRFDKPLASLLVQGSKETVIGTNSFWLEPGDILIACMDMPSSSRILAADSEKPLLTIYFQIDRNLLNQLICRLGPAKMRSPAPSGAAIARADADFMETMLRLAYILDKPDHIPVRAEMALADLHYQLLTGSQGRLVRDFYGSGRNSAHLFSAIEYLRSHTGCQVSAAELAEIANMSESTLYRRFRELTGLSPLQYHKQLRLHEARRLIMTEHEHASSAAYRTGYESVSQFCREYKKTFGISPAKSGTRADARQAECGAIFSRCAARERPPASRAASGRQCAF